MGWHGNNLVEGDRLKHSWFGASTRQAMLRAEDYQEFPAHDWRFRREMLQAAMIASKTRPGRFC
jgi:hypothetical protein